MAGSPYKFNSDELRVLEQCNRESFYQRCLPLATLFGTGTYFAVKSGRLTPSARFGATPKVFGAVCLGYIVGKLSYQRICAEKFMALPDSKLGAMLRSRQAGYQNAMVMDGPDVESVIRSVPSAERYDDVTRPSHMDIDLERPGLNELDDSFRPSVNDSDTVHRSKLDDPFQHPTASYDELRKRNRESYENRSRPFSALLTQDPVSRSPHPPSQPPPPPNSDPWFDSQPNKPSNIYGDIFEK